MSESEWNQHAVFDSPMVRQQVEERIKIERPSEIEKAISPPIPIEQHAELQTIHANPQLAQQLWQDEAAQPAQSVSTPADDRVALAEVGAALYLLHALHMPAKSGQEHMNREDDVPDLDEHEKYRA